MDDRERLEAAAKAAGEWSDKEPLDHIINRWNPLTDDGDALRLAVKLQMSMDTALAQSMAMVWGGRDCVERHGDDPCAATRRAIVRAAAAIGGAK